MPGLDDYGALLRSGSAAVPDYAAEEARKQLLGIQRLQQERLLAEQQREISEQQGFQADLTTVLAHPSAQGYSSLIAKHPKFAQQIKSSWEVLDKARQDSDLQSMSEVYSAAANNKHDLAAALLERRIAADKAAGQEPDPHDQAILDALKSGDPVQQKGALGMMGVTLSAITGPDKFEQTLGALTKGSEGYTLTPGSRRFDAEGNLIAEAPAAPQYREVETVDADGNPVKQIVRLGGDDELTAAPPTANLKPAQAAVATTLAEGGIPGHVVAGFLGNFHAEGGYGGAKGDGGTAQGIAQWRGGRAANFERVIGKPAAEASPQEQAKFVLWEMQNPQAAGMTVEQRDSILNARTPAQAAALIDQFYERSSGQHRPKRMAAATAFANGEVVFSVPGPKKEGFRILTPEEAAEKGLDPATKYQINTKTGQVTAVGGQSRQAKQIPQQVATKIQPSIDIRDTMARLAGRWNPEYGGHQILGNNLNTLQRKLGSWSGAPEGMADWWADFQAMDNLVRNQLFGSALTEHEKQAYAATTISPTMTPSEIVKTFNRKREIINGVVARQERFLKANGYDPEAVDALFSPLDARGGGSQDKAGWTTLPSGLKIRKVN